MDPTDRLWRIGADVSTCLANEGINFGGDFGQKFNSDLNMTFGAFESLLDKIQKAVNADQSLPKLQQLRLRKPGLEGFSQAFYQRAIKDLVWAIDGLISHSPL
jgi:hypothetical protein